MLDNTQANLYIYLTEYFHTEECVSQTVCILIADLIVAFTYIIKIHHGWSTNISFFLQ